MTSIRKIHIETPIGHSIVMNQFITKNTNNIAIICSATGVLQGYYAKFASYLNKNGFTVYTFDYGGIGLSKKESLKTFDSTLSNWAVNDMESVFKYVKKQHPTQNIHCICHSIGGQLLGLAPSNKIFKNIILVTVQNINHSMWKGFGKIQMFVNYHLLIPIITTLFGYLPSKKFMKMENLPKSMALEFASWGRKKNHVFHYKKKDELFHHQIKGNITSYSTENDNFAPEKAVDWMTQKYVNANRTRKHLVAKEYHVKNIGHFGFFKSKYENSIWQEFLSDLNT